MKPIFVFLLIIAQFRLLAQSAAPSMPEIKICKDVSVHFISPQSIQFVDISTKFLAGDLPLKNILRVKINPDSLKRISNSTGQIGVLTILGESFMVQYKVKLCESPDPQVFSQITIRPEDTTPIDVPGIGLTVNDMKAHAIRILNLKTKAAIRATEQNGIKAKLNHVLTVGDYIFLDISYINTTNILFDIDGQRFNVEDRKVNKSTNVQSVEIQPIWKLYQKDSFNRSYRNVFVFKKMTFPGSKVFNIELAEKQLSGRTVHLQVQYRDILKADTF